MTDQVNQVVVFTVILHKGSKVTIQTNGADFVWVDQARAQIVELVNECWSEKRTKTLVGTLVVTMYESGDYALTQAFDEDTDALTDAMEVIVNDLIEASKANG